MDERASPNIDKYLSTESAKICIAKIRALDTHMAANESHRMGSDYDFVANMKDWVDKRKAPLSFRQGWRVDQIWNNITDTIDLDYESFLDGAT